LKVVISVTRIVLISSPLSMLLFILYIFAFGYYCLLW